MENSKYYTPDISEFYVGFEYERRYSNIGEWKKESLEEYMLITPNIGEPCDSEIMEIIQGIREELVRVKLLDKEDIESLGWRNIGIVEGITFSIAPSGEASRYVMHFNNWYNIEIEKFRMTHTQPPITRSIVFKGSLKNKNELRKLMQQLGIKNN